MPLNLTATAGGNFSDWLPEPGSQAAELVGVIDLGMQPDNFGGKDKRSLLLAFELLNQTDPSTGKNFVITEKCTASLNEKAKLTEIITKGFGIPVKKGDSLDPFTLVGNRCMVTVEVAASKTNPDRSYARFAGVSQIPKMLAKPVKELASMYDGCTYDIESGPFQRPDWLPEYCYGEKLVDVIADGRRRMANANSTADEAPF